MTSSGTDGEDLTSPTTTLLGKKEKKALPSPCSAKEVYFGQARRGVKDVTVSAA